MKKIICLILFYSTIVAKVPGSPLIPSHNFVHATARAKFDSLWVDFDITEGGVRGMRIHVSFTVYEIKDKDAYVAIYFSDDLDDRLKDKNGKFASSGGDVALYKSFKPPYDAAVYKDIQLFMPYSELDLDAGDYNLYMEIKLIFPNGDLIQDLTEYDFEYTKPKDINAPATSATASLDTVWVDYDVTENGQKGMRIHVKFSLFNLKDISCDLAVYFEKENGDKILTNNTAYRAKSGQVAIYKNLKPAYNPEAFYKDTQLFMPYKELNLGSGKFDLKMDIDIIYETGSLIKHLQYHKFWLNQ